MTTTFTALQPHFISFATLVRRDVRRFTAVWIQTLLGPAISALLFMLVFVLVFTKRAEVGGIRYDLFLAPGLILMTMIQNAFSNASSVIVSSKMHGSFADLLMAPITGVHVVGSLAIGSVIRASMLFALLLVPLWLTGSVSVWSWPLTIYFGVQASLLFALTGILTGFFADRWEQTSFITAIIITPLTMLSGTFYALSNLPEWVQPIALANPLFHVMNGFRYGMTGFAEGFILAGGIALPVVNLLLFISALLIFRSGWRLRG